MPRHTLPHLASKMRTMEVLITQTTEETIWKHLEKQMVGLEDKIEEFRKHLNDLTDMYFHTNPYDKYTKQDWREGRPKMKHKLDRMYWLTMNGEEYAKDYFDMLNVISDIRICSRAFPEWSERLSDIMEVIEFVRFDTDELVAYESIKYKEAQKRYEESDTEYIQERKEIFNHREFHITREKFLMDDFSRNVMYRGVEPEYWTTCKWCIEYEQRLKDIKEAEAEQERLIQEDNKRYEAELKKKQAEKIENTEWFICECCDYRTSNPDAYDRHLDKKEHKVKQNHADWFCKCCNIQSRSKNEHEFHLKSNKHQKNAGLLKEEEIEIKMFRCECCDYETPRKDYYKLHLSSKKHIKNSSE